jgi:hypothetical protein
MTYTILLNSRKPASAGFLLHCIICRSLVLHEGQERSESVAQNPRRERQLLTTALSRDGSRIHSGSP